MFYILLYLFSYAANHTDELLLFLQETNVALLLVLNEQISLYSDFNLKQRQGVMA